MKALVFAAGLGTRLRPLTDNKPKALVEVGGVPMLERVINKLIDSGITELAVNVHHFPDQIIDFLANRHFPINILVSDERHLLLDTGGGLLAAATMLGTDEPILIHNADILTDFDIAEIKEEHARSGAAASLLVSERQTSRYLLFDNDNRMCGWTNDKTGEILPSSLITTNLTRKAFGGVHIAGPELLSDLANYAKDKEPAFPIMPYYIDACQRLKIKGFTPSTPYMWHDIGKPESLSAAELALKSKQTN
ncbi:MAG: NTP transferase domain-containing protein [Muribaculaceae bacterium]|nr:NTP transferase domain-containing protein [Muribaculaceae bacterium]